MQAMIEDFRILPAGHCGSGAMRNLIYHYCNLDLPEGVIFGLGAGIDTVYFAYEKAQPPFMFFGRGSSMETDVTRNLGIDYREQTQSNDDTAWNDVKAEVMNGHPTMLSGDIFYLDYREFKVHFPGHRFILLGFNEDKGEVYIADRINTHAETCSMGALRQSRSADVGISSHNLWGKFHSSKASNSLPEACGLALKMSVERMHRRQHGWALIFHNVTLCRPLPGVTLAALRGWMGCAPCVRIFLSGGICPMSSIESAT